MFFDSCLFNNKIQYDEKEKNIKNLISQSKYKLLMFKHDLFQLYKIIYKFCAKNKIIISNYNINLDTLDNNSIDSNYEYHLIDLQKDFEFQLLSSNPYKDGIELSNEIYKNYSKYVTMTSYIKNKEILISIDNNKIIKLYLLFLYSDQSTNKIKNINFNTFDLKLDNILIKKLSYSNNLYEILLLSHSLYNPTNFLKYYKELKNQEDLAKGSYNLIFNKLLKSLLNNSYKNKENIIIPKVIIKDSNIFKIRKYLVHELNKEISKLQCVLLDSYSIDYLQAFLNNKKLLNIELFNFDNVLHILISSNYINLIKNIIILYNKKEFNKEYDIIIKINTIYIMNDFRLKRYNISLLNKNNGKKIIIGYFYNSLDYEVIPMIANINNIYIPHPIVLFRFLIINLYYTKLFDPLYNTETYNKFLNKFESIYEILKKYNLSNLDEKVINYIGVYIDERIDKFKLGTLVYRPWQYDIKHQKLLLIE